MKKLFRYLNIATLFIALSAVFASCADNEDGFGNSGLSIKVFSPTEVVPGYPMTINGSGFGDVTEIIFPGDISVTNFSIVTNEMIRVQAPEGLSETGTIKVRNKAGETAESRLPLTIGKTAITGYSAQEGDLIKGNEFLTVYGTGMQFISGAEFIDEDGEPIYVSASEFYRVAYGRVVIQVPANVLTGNATVKLYTTDGKTFESPEFEFETAKSGGHWEITKRYLWKNEIDEACSWGGKYRIGLVGKDGNNECIATLDEPSWNDIKEDKSYFEYSGNESSNVRITTGWWSAAYGGTDHNCIDMAEDNAEGNKAIKLNIKADHNIYDLIDDQHLLFTGSDYTPIGIYVMDSTWVEGEIVEVRTTFWKNGEQSTVPEASWNGDARFASVSHATGEETYAFSEEEWQVLKSESFRVAIEKTDENPNIRVTTGWWSTAYGGGEYNCAALLEQEDDGTYFIELNLANYPDLLNAVDDQHLLFTGSGYKLLEIYQVTYETGGGDSPIVLWENDGSNGAISWNGVYRFSNTDSSTGEEIHAFSADEWSIIKDGTFYLLYDGDDNSNVRITTGWWTGAYGGADHNCIDMAEDDADTGKKVIKINIKQDGNLYDNIDTQHLLFTGDAYTPLKLYYYK